MTRTVILTPDQRVRVFVSSTLDELAEERAAVRRAVESLHLAPVMFELGARPYAPKSLYESYLEQSHIFVGLYWQRYGWIAPEMGISGLEDEYLLAADKPKLLYVKRPAPERDDRLGALLERIRDQGSVSYRPFGTADELERLVVDDLAVLLSESFAARWSSPSRGDENRRPQLPTPPTAFVGRVTEVAQLRDLIGRERLVTLTGPGGIGKTRIALQLAAELAPELPDGAAFVALSSLQDAELVAPAVAETFGVREEGPGDLLQVLQDYLSDRKMLLVLDNFEHVLPAASLVTQLMHGAPDLKLLVTSREALRVLAEHEFPVASLQARDAIELFAQRAGAVRHDFVVGDANVAAVEQIVGALEGVPLAIELAAARTRLMPVEAILDRLDQRLDFLAGGATDLPERQRALRTTMDWSHELLDNDDRRLFARLGVFAGSFSLNAAEAVCDPTRDLDVLAGLASLVDKSLLQAEPSARDPRFRMLAMVREYAREKLLATGEVPAIERKHADFYRDLSLVLRDRLRGEEQTKWIDHLTVGTGAGEIDNIRAAVHWHTDHAEPEGVAVVVWSIWLLSWINGRLDECHSWARQALESPRSLSRKARARLLTVAGLMEMWKGEHVAALPALTEAVEIARQLGDDDVLATSLLGLSLGSHASSVEDTHIAKTRAEEANSLFRASGDRWGQATSFSVLTWFLVAEDDFENTGAVFEAALSIANEFADDLNRAIIETNVAEYRLAQGQYDDARRLLEASLLRYRVLRAFYTASFAVDATARFASLTGRSRAAALLLGAADRARETIGVPVGGAHPHRRNDLETQLRSMAGRDDFDATVAEGRGLHYDKAINAALDALATGS